MIHKYKFLYLIVFSLVFSVSFISIGYSAFSSNLKISGEAVVRRDADVRITNLVYLSKSNDASEAFNSKFSKSLTSMSVSLPNINSSITYRVTVTNKDNKYFSFDSISTASTSNNNVIYNVTGVNVGDIYHDKTITFDITFTTTSLNQSANITIKFDFKVVTDTVWIFDFTGGGQTFNVPYNGTYKLETWGGQGGTKANLDKPGGSVVVGGYGGYSVGDINLTHNDNLYVFVGDIGPSTDESLTVFTVKRAFPNGGAINIDLNQTYKYFVNGGGGSTHISKVNKSIKELGPNSDDLIMVAGGGGGISNWWGADASGGSGGGYIGGDTLKNYMNVNATGGTQTEGGYGGGNLDGHDRKNAWLAGSFGLGGGRENYVTNVNVSGGGGGGYYGGGASWGGAGAGGSGYIGNTNLFNKKMYCFACSESTVVNTYTVSTTGSSSLRDTVNCSQGFSNNAISKCAKAGSGYAKISLLLS